jgi:hypothetical protein
MEIWWFLDLLGSRWKSGGSLIYSGVERELLGASLENKLHALLSLIAVPENVDRLPSLLGVKPEFK